MATIQYTIVFGVLVTEMILFLLLILPLPASWRKNSLLWLARSPMMTPLSYAVAFLFMLIVILFIDSIRATWNHESKYQLAKENFADERARTQLRADLFYAERNFYLTGFTLFLTFVLNRFTNIILSLAITEEKHSALQKQVENQQKEYLKMIEETEKMKQDVDKGRKAVLDMDTMKKQVQNQQDAFDRILKENEELRHKVNGDAMESRKEK